MRLLERVNSLLRTRFGLEVRRVPKKRAASGQKKGKQKGKQRGNQAVRKVGLPPVTTPEGRATASGFFDSYPRFFETSRTSAKPVRLNLRYEAIFGHDPDVFRDATILDLASHDGRWSFAALQTGAKKVIGVEARPDLVDNSRANMAEYGIAEDRYEFHAGDMFKVLAEMDLGEVDVVLCLGFLYHTLRYNELFHHIARANPTHLIIDSRINRLDGPYVLVRTEPSAVQGNAVSDDFSESSRVLTGRPSALAITVMADAYGFDLVRRTDWAALLRDNPIDDSVNRYRVGERTTLHYRRK